VPEFSFLPAAAVAGLLGLFGLLIGSFLNVVIHRLPKMLDREWSEGCRDHLELDPVEEPRYNLVEPRSACPHCGHQIRWFENIPVASYLALGGRCSACKARISPRYPLIELATGALFAWCGYRYGPTWTALAWCGFVGLLLSLTFIDWDEKLLPDDLNYSLLWLGLIGATLGWTEASPASAIVGAFAAYTSLWIIVQIFNRITGKEGMGHGDFKLFAALGAWFGWQALIPIILLSCVVGSVVGICLRIAGRNKPGEHIPFGPFLAGAGFLAMLAGVPVLLYGMAILMGQA
jgi:leader peptidase (prepilin peptidase)/N-methyltransferase